MIPLLINLAIGDNLLRVTRQRDGIELRNILYTGLNFDLYDSLDYCMNDAINEHNWDNLQTIYDYKKLHQEFFNACEYGNMVEIDIFLQHPHINPNEGRNRCLMLAIYKDFINVVERLLQDERIRIVKSLPIFHALIDSDRPKIMKLLLPRLKPHDENNKAIQYACELKRYEIVDILLKDDRVDPTVRFNIPIRRAAQKGFTKIVERLLQHPLVDPSALDNLAIAEAAKGGHDEILDLLLSDPRVNPADGHNRALYSASLFNRLHIVEKLLLNDDVRKGPLSEALSVAKWNGSKDIVQLLRKAKKNRNKIKGERRWNFLRKT